MKTVAANLFVTSLYFSGNAMAADMPELAKKMGCTACHSMDKKIVGPAWRDVAKVYNSAGVTSTGKKAADILAEHQVRTADEWLIQKVSKGGSGNWGSMPMPANDAAGTKQAGIKDLVSFILNLEPRVAAQVSVSVAQPASKPQPESKPFDENAVRKKLAEGAEAKRQEVLKAIAREKDREIAAQEQQERDEFEAREKERTEKAFQASLKKLNAGELYALADKKRSAGELDKAREILRTLITRFPNSPLVALAAQQISQLPAAAEPAMTVTMSKPPAPTQTKAPNRDAGLEDMSGAFAAPKK